MGHYGKAKSGFCSEIRIFRVSKELLLHVVGHCGKVKSRFCSEIRIFRVYKEPLPRPSHTGARRECSGALHMDRLVQNLFLWEEFF